MSVEIVRRSRRADWLPEKDVFKIMCLTLDRFLCRSRTPIVNMLLGGALLVGSFPFASSLIPLHAGDLSESTAELSEKEETDEEESDEESLAANGLGGVLGTESPPADLAKDFEKRLAEIEKKLNEATAPKPEKKEADKNDGWTDISSEKWTVKLAGHVQMDYINWLLRRRASSSKTRFRGFGVSRPSQPQTSWPVGVEKVQTL